MMRLEEMLEKMMMRLDASDEHAKELRGYLANTGKRGMHMQSQSSILS